MGARSVKPVAKEHYLAAKALDRVDLDLGRCGRHHDDRANPETRRRKRYALRMITSRSADHTRSALGLRQLPHAIMRAANLEGKNRLQVFTLEQNLLAQALR